MEEYAKIIALPKKERTKEVLLVRYRKVGDEILITRITPKEREKLRK